MFEDIKKNLADLEKAINDPFLVQDKKKLASVAREHAAAKEIFRLVCEWEKLDADRQKNEKLLIEDTYCFSLNPSLPINSLKLILIYFLEF